MVLFEKGGVERPEKRAKIMMEGGREGERVPFPSLTVLSLSNHAAAALMVNCANYNSCLCPSLPRTVRFAGKAAGLMQQKQEKSVTDLLACSAAEL